MKNSRKSTKSLSHKNQKQPHSNHSQNITVDDLATLLENVRKNKNKYSARCPAHDDHNNSLSFEKKVGGGVLATCHAGCEFEAILAAAQKRKAAPTHIGSICRIRGYSAKISSGKRSKHRHRYEIRSNSDAMFAADFGRTNEESCA